MSTLHELTSESDFNTHVSSLPASTLLVLFFHTPWAAPCTQMRTVLATLASTYPATTPPQITFVSVNAEDLPDVSERYDVTAVPFVVLQKGGTVLESVSGSDVVRVRETIEKFAGEGAGAPAANTNSTVKQTIPPPLDATPRETTTTTSASASDTTGPRANGSTTAPAAAAPATAAQTAPPSQSKEELFARLAELVKAAPVMLFMKGTPSAPQCGFSRQMVSILREHGVKYGFFNILADEDVRQGLKEFADWPTYPQLWVKGELVGGLDIVKEEVAANPDFFKEYAVSRA
ncbi:hypothetical protein VTO42DRAFT_7960 [Malbranchea cinnamomea]